MRKSCSGDRSSRRIPAAKASALMDAVAARQLRALFLVLIACLLASLSSASRATEVYGGLGTGGVEIGLGDRVGGPISLRVSGEFLRISREFESDGATYDTRLKFSNLGLYADYFAFAGGFRLTAGAVIGTRRATGNAVASNGTLSINGSSFPAAGENVGAIARFPRTAPFLGIGYGHHQSSKGSGFYADLGVVIGKAQAQILPSAGIAAAAGQANIDAEQRRLQDSVNKLKAYPIIKMGYSFNF